MRCARTAVVALLASTTIVATSQFVDADEHEPLAPVVVNEVATRGPTGASDEFIELRNVTDAPVDISGWLVERCNNNGFVGLQTTIPASTQLPPGGFYLVVHATGYSGAATPDATYGTGIVDAGGARIRNTAGEVVDSVGFGDVNNLCTVGAHAPSLTNAQGADGMAVTRDADSTNTGENATDFSIQPRTPVSSTGPGDDPDPDPDPDPDLCAVEPNELTPIHEIQGPGDETPIPAQSVVTRGVVTADFSSGGDSGIPANQGLRGFFIEAISDDRDDDPQTSEGVFVFEPATTFDGEIGDLVHVAGTAGEFSDVTQVSATTVEVCDDTGVDATLPPPVELPLPTHPDDRAEVFEPLESMRVVHPELTVVEFFQVERFGEVRLSAAGPLPNPTNLVDPHDDEAYLSVVAANAAANIVLDDGRTGQNLDPLPYVIPGGTLRIGDQMRDIPAVLHFGFGQWRLQPVSIEEITKAFPDNRTRPRPHTPPDVGGTLKVASFNVLNYFDGDGQGGGFPTARGAVTESELVRQTTKLVAAIVAFDADVVGLIEIENDGDDEFHATRTLVEAINAALGHDVYDYVDTGVIGTDAIKLAFIYKPAVVEAVGEHAILDSSVDPRFDDTRSRPVLAVTFEELATGQRVTVANNHLKSKGSACDPDDNDARQGNCNGVRERATEAMADWLASDPTGQGAIGSLIIGDLNAYAKEDPIVALQNAGYTDMLDEFSGGTMPYTFTFDATQGYLDHALADEVLRPLVTGAAAWNINADEVPAIDYLESCCGVPSNQRFRTAEVAELFYDPSEFRSSDHDPVLVGLQLAPQTIADCLHGGWRIFPQFENQGKCIKFVLLGR